MVEIFTLPLGPIQTNCYIIVADNKECIIVDPGAEGEKVLDFVQKSELHPLAILLTHSHFDHIGAVDELVQEWSLPVYVHEKEADRLKDPMLNGARLFHMPDAIVSTVPTEIKAEESLRLGTFAFQVFHTPGHSPGSVSYYLAEANAVFSGDALFKLSIGRTDLPEGSMDVLTTSIREKLYTLPEETVAYPGHGPTTEIGVEKKENPFITAD